MNEIRDATSLKPKAGIYSPLYHDTKRLIQKMLDEDDELGPEAAGLAGKGSSLAQDSVHSSRGRVTQKDMEARI